MQGTEQKIMHQPAVTESNFVLGGMDIHINQCGVQFQIQYKGRVPAVVEHITVGLFDGMGHQLVANGAAIDIEMLQVGLGA